jgi:carbon storage regulator
MLVLTRKVGERIVIDNQIVIEVLQVKGSRVRIGIEAPAGATILRQELLLNDRGAAEAPSADRELAHHS